MNWAKYTLLIFCLCSLLSAAEQPAGETPAKTPQVSTETTAKAGVDGADVDKTPSREERENAVKEQLQVLGSRENARKTPGSAHYISKQDLEQQQYTDIHRILRQVPGVYIQEEDGLGLRPNIGIRGTGVERSQKITLMEDGVLIAPAPYTAPAAYYFPSAGRMETVEVLKGPATVSQGPYTNGGAMNMVSTSIPGAFGGEVTASAGSNNTRRLKASVGSSGERLGWLVETFQLDSDGFKELDGGGDTGSRVNDYMGKLRFNSAGEIYQFLELKLGKTKQLGNETYLGLTEADFHENPVRRYAGSQLDNIDSDHEQLQLRHYIQPTASLSLTTTLYYNDYFRNWHKMEKTLGVGNATILANPDEYAQHLAIIRGEVDSGDDALRIRNNRRNYLSKGIQSTLSWEGQTGAASHELEAGLRYHEDEEDRLQNEEEYRMTGGRMFQTSLGAPGSQANRLSTAEAFSVYVSDTISYGAWTFRPGVRFEKIDYVRNDFDTADPERTIDPTRVRENSVDVVLPGLGVDYAFGDQTRLFAGIYRGFSPPGAGQNEDTREERSTNYEFGWRHARGKFSAEVIGFFNDYENLLGAETVSGGGGEVGALFNGGAVEVRGIEATMSMDLAGNAAFSLPLSVGFTHTSSEFKTSFNTSFADWGPNVTAGDELPYIPGNQLHLDLGYRRDKFSLNLGADFTDEMRTTAGQGNIPEGEGIEDRWVFDLAGDYRIGKNYKVFAQIRNLADEVYVVSRRPYGLRPGLERTFLLGVKAQF